MRDVVFVGVFFISLFTALLCLLPMGLGGGVNENGAPNNPRILFKIGISVAIAVAATGLFYGLILVGVLDI